MYYDGGENVCRLKCCDRLWMIGLEYDWYMAVVVRNAENADDICVAG